jgi:DNA repair photolyase
MVPPLIPGLTDHELPAILSAAARAGARTCAYVPLRLPGAVAGIFQGWLDRHFPERKGKILSRIRSIRGGRLNDSHFHSRMRGQGDFAEQFRAIFQIARRRAGLDRNVPRLCSDHFRRPDAATSGQLSLW